MRRTTNKELLVGVLIGVILMSLVTYMRRPETPLSTVIHRVMPSVVYVGVPSQWSGSGVIIGPSTVLTAGHVVDGANEIFVETTDGKRHEAIYWVADEDNDCGLIFFNPWKKFGRVVELADSSNLQLGDTAIIIGSPYGKSCFNTVTLGIISGLNRSISFFGTDGMITTDAASNPGNSGGPVFNDKGEVIGIAVGSRWGANGFSIITASNTCKEMLENWQHVDSEKTYNAKVGVPSS